MLFRTSCQDETEMVEFIGLSEWLKIQPHEKSVCTMGVVLYTTEQTRCREAVSVDYSRDKVTVEPLDISVHSNDTILMGYFYLLT